MSARGYRLCPWRLALLLFAMAGYSADAQKPSAAKADSARNQIVVRSGDSINVHLIDVDLRSAVQALAPYLDRPVIFGITNGGRVSIESPRPLARDEIVRVLRGVVESQGLDFALDSVSGTYRVRQKEAPPPTVAERRAAPGPPTVPTPDLFVIRLKHARAVDVAATVNALYGRASSLGESSMMTGARGAGPTLSQELKSQPPSPVATVTGQAPGTLSAETVIVPDAPTNSLLVRGTEADYNLIRAAVTQLDIRPLQVLIEVTIAEVERNSTFALGLGASAPATVVRTHSSLDGAMVSGVVGGGPVADSTLGDFVLQVLKGGSGLNFRATLTAAQSRGEAKILSRPVLIAENNETAEILVGSQQPFVEVQRSLPTDSDVRDQVVQYRDVGTRLTVRPTISADGYVVLAVTQEVNQATNQVQFNAPVISTRTVQTQLLVHDSQTVVLGGLSDRQGDRSRSGVPVLSRIPVLGALFGSTQHDASETEFFLFITPRIIRSDEDADSVTAPLRGRTRQNQ